MADLTNTLRDAGEDSARLRDVVEGLRLRAGLLLPIATWMGATPADRDAGIREATLFASLGMAL